MEGRNTYNNAMHLGSFCTSQDACGVHEAEVSKDKITRAIKIKSRNQGTHGGVSLIVSRVFILGGSLFLEGAYGNSRDRPNKSH